MLRDTVLEILKLSEAIERQLKPSEKAQTREKKGSNEKNALCQVDQAGEEKRNCKERRGRSTPWRE